MGNLYLLLLLKLWRHDVKNIKCQEGRQGANPGTYLPSCVNCMEGVYGLAIAVRLGSPCIKIILYLYFEI